MEKILTKEEAKKIASCLKEHASMFKNGSYIVDANNNPCLTSEQERIVNFLPAESQTEARKSLLKENMWASNSIRRDLELAERVENAKQIIIL